MAWLRQQGAEFLAFKPAALGSGGIMMIAPAPWQGMQAQLINRRAVLHQPGQVVALVSMQANCVVMGRIARREAAMLVASG